jgi:hypothetical protein
VIKGRGRELKDEREREKEREVKGRWEGGESEKGCRRMPHIDRESECV